MVWSFTIFRTPSHCVVLICNTERLRRGLGGCSEIGFALLQHLSAHFNLSWPCPTVWGCCPSTTLAFQRLADFRSFRPLRKSDVPIASKSRRKRQKSTKVGHSGCYLLPRSRSFSICDSQQSTHGPSAPRHKRNAADARPWVKDTWGCADTRHPESNTCVRASQRH